MNILCANAIMSLKHIFFLFRACNQFIFYFIIYFIIYRKSMLETHHQQQKKQEIFRKFYVIPPARICYVSKVLQGMVADKKVSGELMGEKTELMTLDNIRNRVFVIRGQQVMLDYDLAEIYGYEVRAMNQQVKRNIDRFPEDFMFQLKKEEVPEEFSKSQIVTLNESGDKRGTNIKKLPYAIDALLLDADKTI